MATFITSKLTGETISVNTQTSTGYWKYNHNGTDSSVFSNGLQTITVTNANGEFTIIPCLSNGTVSGDITQLGSKVNQLTSFDGTGLSGLTNLNLDNNQLTSFDGTGLSGLTTLDLRDNPLTTFIGGDMGQIGSLNFAGWNITTLESFDGTGLSGLTSLDLSNNPLTTFIGGDMGLITELNFPSWNITTLETFDITGMDNLQYLYVENNTSINNTSVNNSLLAKLAANELANDWDSGEFITEGGRTSAGTADYDYLIGEGWTIDGADLVSVVRKLRVKGVGQLNP